MSLGYTLLIITGSTGTTFWNSTVDCVASSTILNGVLREGWSFPVRSGYACHHHQSHHPEALLIEQGMISVGLLVNLATTSSIGRTWANSLECLQAEWQENHRIMCFNKPKS
ncbi:hypothetical protein FRX31_002836 [Thalictrum thalictroides]|uniref:Uncharacterized protein n=1 Tax=Thalictrum thalictroides TaxID=46969 RepID=A0A7J6XF68_THATH|nr:hypothetical protein FRX31_002836 [Thalictrum thalictroides]